MRGDLLLALEVALRGEAQPQIRVRSRILGQNQALCIVPFAFGRGACEVPKFVAVALLGCVIAPVECSDGATPFVGIADNHPMEQGPDVLGTFTRQENMERLRGACQCDIEQVDVVDVRIDQLPIVGLGKRRFGHLLLVAHRKRAQRCCLACLGRCPDNVAATSRLRSKRPTAIGNDDHRFLQSFGFVDGRNFDGRAALLDRNRTLGTLLVPPIEEESDVGDAVVAEGDNLLVQGLQVGRFVGAVLELEVQHQLLEGLLG